MACNGTEGFLKDVGNEKFVHQICALTFKFSLKDPVNMKFEVPHSEDEEMSNTC